MPNPTANYGWLKPDVGASNDQWGGLLNTDLDGIDSTVFGVQQSVPQGSNATPVMNGTAAAGVGTAFSRADHVHPSDTSRVAKTGDTMTGTLTLAPPSGAGIDTLNASPVAGPCNIHMNVAAAGNLRQFVGTTNNVARWNVVVGNAAPESGSNAGSDFGIVAYSDAGAALGTPMQVWRATATVAFNAVGATSYSGAAGVGDANLFLNKAGSGHLSRIFGANNGVFRWGLVLGDSTAESSNAGSNFVISAYNDAGAAASVPTPMSIARATGVATFAVAIVNGSSDQRLKENIAPLEGSLDKIKALQGVSFNMIETPNKAEIGLIAQDVRPIVPEVIQLFHLPEHQVTKDEPYMALDYPKLVAHLIEAIKTLAARVEALEAARG